jgi:hypothetical protein
MTGLLKITDGRPPANIKDNPSEEQYISYSWRKEKKHDNNCPKGLGLFLFGLSPKRNKKNTLCALCVSSEAGGESMSKY